MPATFFLEQILNGLQFGFMLFLIAAGLTLIFGIMDFMNLAHSSIYMIGAYLMATYITAGGNFFLGIFVAVLVTGLLGMLLERFLLRHLYERDHLSQVLATFALILIFNELVRLIWGPQPILLTPPEVLSRPIKLFSGFEYSAYRLFIIVVGLVLAVILFWVVNRTRVGMWLRAGASNREIAETMGVPIRRLFTFVFGFGAGLAAVAGASLGPILAVQIGMGENILILAFVVIVIGGIGSIKGALVGSLLVGMVDVGGRAFLPLLFARFASPEVASNLGPAIASILIYLLMASVLLVRPRGLFPVGT